MPFIAVYDGDKVIPEQVEDGVDVRCAYCNDRMRPRGPTVDGKARHFFHIGDIGKAGSATDSCSGGGEGESETHRKFKSLVVSRLKRLYDDSISSCRPEQQLTVEGQSTSGSEKRQADVLMEMSKPTSTFGRGLVVEVQYRNLGKDIEATTSDYLSIGYSVLWVDEDDFAEDRCLLTGDQIREEIISVWPNAVPNPPWGTSEYPPPEQMICKQLPSVGFEHAVPATFHLERWGREVREMPPVDQWAMSAVEADWGLGGVTVNPHGSGILSLPISTSVPHIPNHPSRDVTVPATFPPGWIMEVDSVAAARVRKAMNRAFEAARSAEERRVSERSTTTDRRRRGGDRSVPPRAKPKELTGSLDFKPHPNAGIRPEPNGECRGTRPKDWCLGPQSEMVVYQCWECAIDSSKSP